MEIPKQLLPRLPEDWLQKEVQVVQSGATENHAKGSNQTKPTCSLQPFSRILAKHPKTLVVLVRHPG